jgi:hypothetical protein
MKIEETLSLFHHIHHRGDNHEVHHCGGRHREEVDPKLDYTIKHCACGKHRIDKEQAIGYATNERVEPVEMAIKFTENCPEGGWHVESGILANQIKIKIQNFS